MEDFFSQNEWDLQRRVIIVGGTVRDGFFQGKDPIGKKIRLNNVTFEIIGELKKTRYRNGSRWNIG